jgi:hypothetical protein
VAAEPEEQPELSAAEHLPNSPAEVVPEHVAEAAEPSPAPDVPGPASVALVVLGRPVAIFAGSGSGRTVLLKRLIEETALAGVPTLVVDAGGELAQLADPWPVPPPQWSDDDAAKAAAFRQRVEVELVMPSVSSAAAALPDFSRFDNAEARERAIEATCLALRPFLPKGSSAPEQAVLADALRFLALRRACSLAELVGLLEELPVGISQIGHAPAFAAQMAEHLRAARTGGAALQLPAFDPGFLTATGAGNTRICVISLSCLPSEEARLRYVDALQRALLAWMAQRETTGPLLLVLDETHAFGPGQTDVASRESALALASQAGNRGFGLIVATTAAKNLDPEVAARCTTRFYGRMHAPALIQATNELLAQAGLGDADVGKLAAGEFYAAGPGTDRPAKVHIPVCLSWHRRPPAELPERTRHSTVLPIRRTLAAVSEETDTR